MKSELKIFSRISAAVRLAFFASIAGLLAVSCTDDRIDVDSPDGLGGYITLQLSSVKSSSRAITGTENDVNYENRLDDVWVCLFPAGSGDDARPVLMQKVAVNYAHEVEGNNATTVTLRFNRDLIPELFPDGNSKAIAYVIANLPGTTTFPGNPTYGQLKALPISANFASATSPTSFVMDGDGEITKEDTSDAAQTRVTGDVHLKRAASKITLNVKVASEVEDAYGEKWTSRTGNMIVLIHNGVSKSQVQSGAYTPDPDVDYYSTELGNADRPARGFTNSGDTDPEGFPFTVEKPFYSYPNNWSDDSELMTYFTLIVQWQNGGSFRTCYYMVPVVGGQSYIARNVSYRVNIDVNILGSTKPEEPLVLEDVSYRAVDWGSEKFDVQIDDFRYLVVDQNVITMNNEGQISIPFYSSHETVIKYDLDTLNYYLYNTTAAGLEKTMAVTNAIRDRSTTTVLPDSVGTSVKMFSDWIDNKPDDQTNTRTLHFHHELYQWRAQYTFAGGYRNLPGGYGPYASETAANTQLNRISRYTLENTDSVAFSRYRMTITIVHKDKIGQADEAQYSEKFVIWQYPAMYIEADPNVYIINNNQPYGAAVYGNVYINGKNSGNSGAMVPSGLTGGNRNPNMYIVTITQLSDDRYKIGDPRSTTSSTLNYKWTEAPAIGATSERSLQYYYPTNTSTDNQFVVSPKLRIASSYGVSPTMSKTNAERRCAGYQEMYCPAGRWRLPTYGELEFIINLSNSGKIPVLFSANSNYWTAQGRVSGSVDANGHLGTPNNGNVTGNVRCVYDEGYWGESRVSPDGTRTWRYNRTNYPYTYYPFTWGDAQMNY